MTDKERLERIVNRYAYRKTAMIPIYRDDYNSLIELAKKNELLSEQVQELERQLENKQQHKMTYRKIARRYQKESIHYREAIEQAINIAKSNVISSPSCSDIEVVLIKVLEEYQ